MKSSVASVVEDVLQQHGNRSRGLDLDARRALRSCSFSLFYSNEKRFAGGAFREGFRLGLRSGIILCNAINKVQPGAVHQKVVEGPYDSPIVQDGAALSAPSVTDSS
ncbi:hypothetical protein Leryth_023678 [Lithospermum erythrorhizon]|nr:hypothetical protein Leryth_023678 [Lithospermum erythrorhizon]